MRIEDQICTLYQAKKLKELGIDEPTAFYWMEYELSSDKNKVVSYEALPIKARIMISMKTMGAEYGCFPAFTVAELGVMLPDFTETWRDEDCIWCSKESGIHPFKGETEAQVKAIVLIYFLETNQITVAEINERLK